MLGIYYKKKQFPEALELFEQLLEILDNLNFTNDPITRIIKENVEFLKEKAKLIVE